MTHSQGDALEAVIGLEVHAQIVSDSKMFCPCSARYFGAPPNTHVCAVCGGFPGALPTINRRGVDATILTGMALECDIARRFKFDRKNYAYPDLPKGYQITQYDLPIAQNGHIEFVSEGDTVVCGITRVHLEEDTGKSTHGDADHDRSLIDFNRSGVPLMEIVGEPDLHSAQAARDYFAALREILMYLGVSDGNLQEGSLRADVNISVRTLAGSLGTKVEIKNLNSFRAVFRAVDFELDRQRDLILAGQEVAQETRGWSDDLNQTVAQRSKEYAHDYRYFPEPDLPPVVISEDALTLIQRSMPELPTARRLRFVEQYGLDRETAEQFTLDQALGTFFEASMAAKPTLEPAVVARWLNHTVRGLCNERGIALRESALTPDNFGELLALTQDGEITGETAKGLLPDMLGSGTPAGVLVDERGLARVSDWSVIERWVLDALEANPRVVEDYLSGKEKAMNRLVGQVMGMSRGKASVEVVTDLVRKGLESQR